VQVTETFPLFVQVQPVPVAETYVTPAGSESVTMRAAASDGPAFATTSVYVSSCPMLTVAGDAAFVSERSALVTSVSTFAVLLSGFGSSTLLVTVALFVTIPLAVGLTTIVTVAEYPGRSEPISQLTVLPRMQVPRVELTETGVTLAGSVSSRWTSSAEGGCEVTTSPRRSFARTADEAAEITEHHGIAVPRS